MTVTYFAVTSPAKTLRGKKSCEKRNRNVAILVDFSRVVLRYHGRDWEVLGQLQLLGQVKSHQVIRRERATSPTRELIYIMHENKYCKIVFYKHLINRTIRLATVAGV